MSIDVLRGSPAIIRISQYMDGVQCHYVPVQVLEIQGIRYANRLKCSSNRRFKQESISLFVSMLHCIIDAE